MKRTILFLVCLMGMTFAFAQSRLQDVVYMKNGEIIRGNIIEMIPERTVRISLDNGCVFIRDYADVERFAKEPAIRTVSGLNYDKKSPWVSGILSYFVPGLGQFYNGENRKGWIDLGTQAAGLAAVLGGTLLEADYIPDDFILMEDGSYYSPYRDIHIITGGRPCHSSEFLRTTGYVLMAAGAITFYANWIHSIVDAAKSSKRINAENGYVMYQINDRCAFGMQPSIAYERPQYLQGSKPELTAGMNFKLTF